MANTDKRNGFQLITGGGKAPRRVLRTTNSGSANSLMAPGDGYLLTNGLIVRQTTDATGVVSGIMEAVSLPGAAIAEGPMTYDYVPASTELDIIGIEDDQAEFECTAVPALALADYDNHAIVGLDDTAPDVTLRISRQAVGAATSSQTFILVRPVDRPNNDQYAAFARVVVKLLATNLN